MIVPYQEVYLPEFERLNREWIERYFRVEPLDEKYFADPYGLIIAPGGQIFFAIQAGQAVGTSACVHYGEGRYELSKMAVTPRAQGQGFGRQLAQAAIDFARLRGGTLIFVVSSSKLIPAVTLYERLGFRHAPYPEGMGWERGDVYMELAL